jgi:hypothetical protein
MIGSLRLEARSTWAVDLARQLLLELRDVAEGFEALVVEIFGNREGVFRAFEVGVEHLDRLVLHIGLPVRLHGGHPVAEEDVDVLVLHGRVGDRNGQHLGLRAVAEPFQQAAGDGRGRRDVGPSHIREARALAARGLGREGRRRARQPHQQRNEQFGQKSSSHLMSS